MMTNEEIVRKINESMVREFELDPEKMRPEAHLIQDLELDSLDFVDLVVVLQNAFGVKLRENPRIREVRTLGDLHALIIEIKTGLEADGRLS